MSRSPLERLHLSFPQPVDESNQVHRRGIDRLLQLCPSQPDIAAAAQIKATHALRETAFHPGSQRVLGLEFIRLLPLARGLDRLVLRLRPHRQLTRLVLSRGATGAHLAGPTRGTVKPDAHHGITGDVVPRRPPHTVRPLGTASGFRLPIQLKGL